MKLTKEQITSLCSTCGDDGIPDCEQYHRDIDQIIRDRLRELDPEFMQDIDLLDKKTGVAYWYS